MININKLKKAVEKQYKKLVYELSSREIVILEMRFGLKTGRTSTLEEVGKMFNITRERVRQIEAKALEKLGGMDKFIDKQKVKE